MSGPSFTTYELTGSEWTDNLDADGRWDPQCTVTTRRGTRCSFRIFAGQVYWRLNPLSKVTLIAQHDADTFHAGKCAYHAKLDRDGGAK